MASPVRLPLSISKIIDSRSSGIFETPSIAFFKLSRVVGEEREKTGKYKRLVSSISVALMLSVVILVI